MRLNYIITFVIIQLAFQTAKAQLNPPGGQYFFNPFIANPALAGLEKGLSLSTSYRKQFSTTPGGPLSRLLTVDYQATERLGLGLNVTNESAGLLEQTRLRGVVAYRLPVGITSSLHFGIGLGFMDEHINEHEVIGSDDPGVADFNNRDRFVDASFGMAYHLKDFSLQGAIPNMKEVFTKDDHRNTIDRSLYMVAVAYRFRFGRSAEDWFIEPKLVYRGIKGMDAIVDAGAQLAVLTNQLRVVALYHSTRSATFGFGFQGRKDFGVQALYTAGIRSTASALGNNFELNVRLRLFDH